MKAKKDYAADVDTQTKMLEEEEAKLLNKLNQTYQTQQHME